MSGVVSTELLEDLSTSKDHVMANAAKNTLETSKMMDLMRHKYLFKIYDGNVEKREGEHSLPAKDSDKQSGYIQFVVGNQVESELMQYFAESTTVTLAAVSMKTFLNLNCKFEAASGIVFARLYD
jgi:uncharacterized protein (DUF952 family)